MIYLPLQLNFVHNSFKFSFSMKRVSLDLPCFGGLSPTHRCEKSLGISVAAMRWVLFWFDLVFAMIVATMNLNYFSPSKLGLRGATLDVFFFLVI